MTFHHSPKPPQLTPDLSQRERRALEGNNAIYYTNMENAKTYQHGCAKDSTAYQAVMKEQAGPSWTTEQPQSAGDLIISRCPKCNDQFTYVEEVLIHKFSTKTEDLRAEFQDFLELREALIEDFTLRTLKHNAKIQQIHEKGATVT